MPSSLEMLADIGAQHLETLAKTYGGSTAESVFKDKEDPPYVIRPSQLELLRRRFIAQYLQEQELLRRNANQGLRGKIDTELSKPLPTAVQGYLNTATS